MKRDFLLSMLLLIISIMTVEAGSKIKLKVLYVGGSSEYETMGGTDLDSATIAKGVEVRANAFESLLKENFTDVTAINAKGYKWQMSNDYDVTIMDGRPIPLKKLFFDYFPDGRVKDVHYAEYTPQDFDRPMLCIANASEDIGRGIGVKNDWYCLCLQNDAYGMNLKHTIFNSPYKVQLTLEEKPTPEAALSYQFEFDKPIAKTQQMWNVQNNLYSKFETSKYLRVGMVTRPAGYLDSPDTEIISGGVSAKSPDAISIGRHANWFHWGFAASPINMTDEAKKVFINAIVYTSKFAGHRIIARKYNESIATSEALKSLAYSCTKAAYENMLKVNEEFNQSILKIKKDALEKKAKGESITKAEEMYLEFEPQPQQSYENWLKSRHEGAVAKVGLDETAIKKYYSDNADYFYGERDGYNLIIDQDAKVLRIKVGTMKLLETAINLLLSGNNEEKARGQRILDNYTLLRNKGAKGYSDWYKKNKKNIFFTQSGGWLYLVNTLDKNVDGNNYEVIRNKKENVEKKENDIPAVGITDDRNPVAVTAKVNKLSDKEYEIVVRMKIHPGYHTYGHVSQEDPFMETTLEITPAQGQELKGELQEPKYKILNSTGTTIYEDDVIWKQLINANSHGEVKVNIGWQVCNNNICMQPQQKEIILQIQ